MDAQHQKQKENAAKSVDEDDLMKDAEYFITDANGQRAVRYRCRLCPDKQPFKKFLSFQLHVMSHKSEFRCTWVQDDNAEQPVEDDVDGT